MAGDRTETGSGPASAPDASPTDAADPAAATTAAGTAPVDPVAGDSDSGDSGATAAAGEDAADDSVDLADLADLADSAPAGEAGDVDQPSVELSEDQIVSLIAERDEYLDGMQRIKAEFANARRRFNEQSTRQRELGAADLAERLLPVLDSVDAAVAQGVDQVEPIGSALFEALASKGLERLEPTGDRFDPELHEAVMHEPGDGSEDGPMVVETLRSGYGWGGRVLRPAMVRVQG